MIQNFFQLQRQPFLSIPSPDNYFPAASIEAARSALVRLIERREGPGLVIGPVGTGKSLLCQMLAESFRHRCRVLVLPGARLSGRRALLQVILFELGLPYRDMDEGELRLSLIDHLTNREVCPQGVLLLVDECENLVPALLDELRSLTNIAVDGRSCLRLVLFGAPRLEERFTHPRLESFNQRLAGRFYLEPFGAQETSDFIQQTIEDCGGRPEEIFTPAAMANIHRACGGIPRLVNQLADHAMVLAAANHRQRVDASCVEEAWADLQQLPAPRTGPEHDFVHSASADIVEFGTLDEAAEEPLTWNEPASEQLTSSVPPIEVVDDPLPAANPETPPAQMPLATANALQAQSEVTLVFHSSRDPFGDDFEDEELVIDHFISPDALAQRHRRQVEAAASQRLADQLFQLRRPTVASSPPTTITAEVPPARDTETELLDDDPEPPIISLGEHPAGGFISQTPQHGAADAAASTAEVDLAEVVEAGAAPGDASRNYRKLFSQLRRRQG